MSTRQFPATGRTILSEIPPATFGSTGPAECCTISSAIREASRDIRHGVAQFRRALEAVPLPRLLEMYATTHAECALVLRRIPQAVCIRMLVEMWRQLRRLEKRGGW